VIVPVYNEGKNFSEWHVQAMPHLPPGTVVRIVYDRDDDDTLPVARALADKGAPIVPLKNTGKGVIGALKTGLRSADEGPILVSMADLSDDFAVIPRMLDEYRAGASVVVASRYMPGGRQIGGPWLKGQFSKLGGQSLKWLAGFPVHDATNSFRLYDAALVKELELESTGGFEVGFEITLKAWELGKKVVEVPCTWRDRVEGESRFKLRKWLPLYGRLWLRAMKHGLLRAR
jgi:glycosyltransferase involved in cell wall biosynthesis